MIKIISKENKEFFFEKEEIALSVFLSNFFNKNFYNFDDDEANEANEANENEANENDEDEANEAKILKLDISTYSLIKIKQMTECILKKQECLKYIKISETFNLTDFFILLDAVNYLHIETILLIMTNYIKDKINTMTIDDTKRFFKLENADLVNPVRMDMLNNLLSNEILS
tara:strand:+ start:9815 stop:10330 length:516 start_codon:yes stop_codon:yes gene_type:complete